MSKTRIRYSHEETVVTLTLDDGKGNVLDHLMMEELQEHLNALYAKDQVKLLLLEGAGKHFSFGASVEEHRRDSALAMLRQFHQLFYTLRDLAIPSAALLSGQCLGGGLELALMCNFLFADATARMGQPEIVLGVFPPPASILLPEKIGHARAEELLITGKTITAEEAAGLGLVNRLFDHREAMTAGVLSWAEEHILPRSASSLRYAVRAVRMKMNHVLTNFLPQLESLYVNQLMNTHDANEGIHSFLEKRKPVWQNN